jgi:hypothetical protein
LTRENVGVLTLVLSRAAYVFYKTRFTTCLVLRREWSRARQSLELITAIFTVVLAAATVVLGIAAIGQHADTVEAIEATNRLAGATEKYTTESKRLADAAELSAKNAEVTANAAKTSAETSQKEYVANQRAWIAPMGMVLDEAIEKDKTIGFTLYYDNTGRGPARNVAHISASRGVRPVPAGHGWTELQAGDDDICGEISSKEGMPTVYPSSTPQYFMSSNTSFSADDAYVQGNTVLIVKGCFRYLTFGTVHDSAYCYYLKPAPGEAKEKWRFGACADGHRAN